LLKFGLPQIRHLLTMEHWKQRVSDGIQDEPTGFQEEETSPELTDTTRRNLCRMASLMGIAPSNLTRRARVAIELRRGLAAGAVPHRPADLPALLLTHVSQPIDRADEGEAEAAVPEAAW
jgi:hypothetical protein